MGTIAEKLTYLEGTKSAIKDAIIAKGVDVTDNDTFRSYAEKIEAIEGGGSCDSQEKEISITDNGTRVVTPDEGYLLNQVTINTNVTVGKPQIPNGISFENSTWTTFDTDPYDWSQVYSGTQIFYNCRNLQTLTGSGIQNVYFLDFYNTFKGCEGLTTIPKLQGKPVTMSGMFQNCMSLRSFDFSSLDLSDLVDISYVFHYCNGEWLDDINFTSAPIIIASSAFQYSGITKLPSINYSKIENASMMLSGTSLTSPVTLDMPNVVNAHSLFQGVTCTEINLSGFLFNEYINSMFLNCKAQKISAFNCGSVKQNNISTPLTGCTNLIDFGGFINIGESFTSTGTLDISGAANLSKDSILNVFNNLYDFVGNGSSLQPTIKLHSSQKAKLETEDLTIATAKGWKIS